MKGERNFKKNIMYTIFSKKIGFIQQSYFLSAPTTDELLL